MQTQFRLTGLAFVLWTALGVWGGLGEGQAQTVTGLTLVDSSTDTDIGPLSSGAVVDLADVGTALNVRANVSGSVGSVRFGLNGDSNYQTENVSPFALEGDSSGDYDVWTPAPGPYTLTATAFSGANATGSSGSAVTVTFEVVGDGGGNPGGGDNQPPVVEAGAAGVAVSPQATVTLDGSANDPDGTVVDYEWTQQYGPSVTISDVTAVSPTISGIPADAVVGLRLTATDDDGATGFDDVIVMQVPSGNPASALSGELKKWHTVTIDFTGPVTNESANPNPFRDYRLDVLFTNGNRTFVVPGFYAADGDAAETGADSGDQWRARFAPDATGTWNYTAIFRTGSDVAVADNAAAGSPDASIHGARGTFTVTDTDKVGRDHRAQGRLQYVGEHHLRFAETGEYYLKGGADSPENFLAYEDFDGTYDAGGSFLHDYSPHAADWNSGDPQWDGTRGREIIGALNYLSSEGMNSVYFLTMNVTGDGKDVWPWTSDSERNRFDVSKLEQWEIVFAHMDHEGIALHVITQEQENDQLLNNGSLGIQRKLYYRELVARMAHHLAVFWNLGEENTNTDSQRKQFATFIRNLDPYDHPIVVHTFPGQKDAVYNPLLGYPDFEGPSLQGGFGSVHNETIKWIDRSSTNGRPWVVCNDENGPATAGVVPDADDPTHDEPRKEALWGNLMAGGGGAEWYFGYSFPNDDLDCEDWRSRDNMWDQTRYALEFFQQHLPFWTMATADSLTSSSSDYCFADIGQVYAVYLPDGGTTQLQVTAGTYTVAWYDPRNGGALQNGSVTTVSGPGNVALGSAPSNPGQDWAILVRREAVIGDFTRGDCNGDGLFNIADVIRTLDPLFGSGAPYPCDDACDTNDDGSHDISDAINALSAIFSGGSIPGPNSGCGADPTADSLDCASFGACP